MLSAAEFKNAEIEPSQSSSGKRASTSKNTHAKGFPDERSQADLHFDRTFDKTHDAAAFRPPVA